MLTRCRPLACCIWKDEAFSRTTERLYAGTEELPNRAESGQCWLSVSCMQRGAVHLKMMRKPMCGARLLFLLGVLKPWSYEMILQIV